MVNILEKWVVKQKIFSLYLLTCRVVEVLTIYKFLVYTTKTNSINYENISM